MKEGLWFWVWMPLGYLIIAPTIGIIGGFAVFLMFVWGWYCVYRAFMHKDVVKQQQQKRHRLVRRLAELSGVAEIELKDLPQIELERRVEELNAAQSEKYQREREARFEKERKELELRQKKFERTMREQFGEIWRQAGLTESPPELTFLLALNEICNFTVDSETLFGQDRKVKLRLQHKIGNYRVDFLANDDCIIEIDGYEFHGTKESFQSDRVRDQQLQKMGYRVVRFPATQVLNDPKSSAETALNIALKGGEDE